MKKSFHRHYHFVIAAGFLAVIFCLNFTRLVLATTPEKVGLLVSILTPVWWAAFILLFLPHRGKITQ